MSIDIRRSTELMLKARSPEEFASFITTLSTELMKIVMESYGVFDKFTGDGVLAFFPEFYSGPEAASYAIATADKCHAAFARHYRTFRKSFTSVLTEIGLGIGIDYGSVHLVQLGRGLTVVGTAVVYACRLSGAPAGGTLSK
jgi:class 3 adenylate cyclase